MFCPTHQSPGDTWLLPSAGKTCVSQGRKEGWRLGNWDISSAPEDDVNPPLLCGDELGGTTYPELSAKDGDLAFNLLLSQAPLDGVQAILHGQGDVAAPDGGGDGAREDMGLAVEADAHPVGVHHPQGAVIAELVAVPHLIWRNASGGGDGGYITHSVTRDQNGTPALRGFHGTVRPPA